MKRQKRSTSFFSQGINSLTVGEIVQMEVFHGIDNHNFIHLIHDELLIIHSLSCFLPTEIMLQKSDIDCFKKLPHLKCSNIQK